MFFKEGFGLGISTAANLNEKGRRRRRPKKLKNFFRSTQCGSQSTTEYLPFASHFVCEAQFFLPFYEPKDWIRNVEKNDFGILHEKFLRTQVVRCRGIWGDGDPHTGSGETPAHRSSRPDSGCFPCFQQPCRVSCSMSRSLRCNERGLVLDTSERYTVIKHAIWRKIEH